MIIPKIINSINCSSTVIPIINLIEIKLISTYSTNYIYILIKMLKLI